MNYHSSRSFWKWTSPEKQTIGAVISNGSPSRYQLGQQAQSLLSIEVWATIYCILKTSQIKEKQLVMLDIAAKNESSLGRTEEGWLFTTDRHSFAKTVTQYLLIRALVKKDQLSRECDSSGKLWAALCGAGKTLTTNDTWLALGPMSNLKFSSYTYNMSYHLLSSQFILLYRQSNHQ